MILDKGQRVEHVNDPKPHRGTVISIDKTESDPNWRRVTVAWDDGVTFTYRAELLRVVQDR